MDNPCANSPLPCNGSQPEMPLALARPGEEVILIGVRGGIELRRRLAEMGMGPGSRFAVETCGRPGPFVISVKGSRLILGHGMVQRIFVRPCGGNASENKTR